MANSKCRVVLNQLDKQIIECYDRTNQPKVYLQRCDQHFESAKKTKNKKEKCGGVPVYTAKIENPWNGLKMKISKLPDGAEAMPPQKLSIGLSMPEIENSTDIPDTADTTTTMKSLSLTPSSSTTPTLTECSVYIGPKLEMVRPKEKRRIAHKPNMISDKQVETEKWSAEGQSEVEVSKRLQNVNQFQSAGFKRIGRKAPVDDDDILDIHVNEDEFDFIDVTPQVPVKNKKPKIEYVINKKPVQTQSKAIAAKPTASTTGIVTQSRIDQNLVAANAAHKRIVYGAASASKSFNFAKTSARSVVAQSDMGTDGLFRRTEQSLQNSVRPSGLKPIELQSNHLTRPMSSNGRQFGQIWPFAAPNKATVSGQAGSSASKPIPPVRDQSGTSSSQLAHLHTVNNAYRDVSMFSWRGNSSKPNVGTEIIRSFGSASSKSSNIQSNTHVSAENMAPLETNTVRSKPTPDITFEPLLGNDVCLLYLNNRCEKTACPHKHFLPAIHDIRSTLQEYSVTWAEQMYNMRLRHCRLLVEKYFGEFCLWMGTNGRRTQLIIMLKDIFQMKIYDKCSYVVDNLIKCKMTFDDILKHLLEFNDSTEKSIRVVMRFMCDVRNKSVEDHIGTIERCAIQLNHELEPITLKSLERISETTKHETLAEIMSKAQSMN